MTINYTLKMRGKNATRVATLLEKLRQKALDLPFESVSPEVIHLTPEVCAPGLEHYRGSDGAEQRSEEDQGIFWLLLSCSHHGLKPPWGEKRDTYLSVDPVEAYVFQTWPGHGCEAAMFGLARYPAQIEAPYRPQDDDRFSTQCEDGHFKSWEFDPQKWERHVRRLQQRAAKQGLPAPLLDPAATAKRTFSTGLGGVWRLRSFCKTQYASDPRHGGINNFLRCHLSVIRMLEYAEELGLEVDVEDEGHFGPACYTEDVDEARAAGREPTYVKHPASHDIKRLIERCGVHNRLVAGLFGTLKDAMGENAQGMVSPIANYPNFEHLEAEFHIENGDKFDALIKSLGAMVKKAAEEAEEKSDEQ
ncbi:MAG: hypothetical protein K8T91_03845 [Planctomycetes bacterium]|nr:hypothetical protein [Planctomycetota bacterium]